MSRRPRRAGPIRSGLLVCLLVVAAPAGCGAAATPRPEDSTAGRRTDLGRLGAALHRHLQGRPARGLWLEETEVRRWFAPALANVVLARRAGAGGEGTRLRGLGGRGWSGTRFVGLCVQGLRRVAPGGAVPVRRQAWLFERALLEARRPGGARLGAWVEGIFLWTERGWRLVDLEAVEPPRWEHADLDLAPCDARSGPRGAQARR